MQTQIAVIGAGHAGVEAALAAARLGVDTVLFTMSLDAIANMPCNPSIGGTAKGHLVYEIDALGGEMGRAADLATLQSRTLNLGKGAAVHSKRVQADRIAYRVHMKHVLETAPLLRVVQAEIVDIKTTTSPDGRPHISHVITKLGEIWNCSAAVIATGTYLESAIFVGDAHYEAGPDGFLPAKGLSDSLRELGVTLMRFKTGTPARVLRSSVHLDELEEQPGETPILPYSDRTDPHFFDHLQQIPCHIVYTNAETHRIIHENIHRSALYGGHIRGTGPRYCPSIEDKITRFADKERHQLFVEPMGKDTEELYLQGFSTSLPADVQHEMIHSLKGFDDAQIMRYAYAIEYDCADPTQLYATLEFKEIDGLYGAGQFNGTSGYEEAAAQGLVAGANAALKLLGKPPLMLSRSDGYIGTLIDDLVTKGTNEPYRMMTSRSEFRLLLRQDNADLRLTPMGYRCGLVSEERYAKFCQKLEAEEAEKKRLESTHLSPKKVNPFLAKHGMDPVKSGVSLADLLRRPSLSYADLTEIDPLWINTRENGHENSEDDRPLPNASVLRTVESDIKYAGYIQKELAEVNRQKKLEAKALPPDLNYSEMAGLRLEARQKLDKFRPLTVGQASRISGVSPADISVLLLYLGLK